MEAGEVAYTDGQTGEMVRLISEIHTVGVFLEEVQYFLDDMKRDLWWLLMFAHQPSSDKFCRGNEDLLPVDPNTQAIIERLRFRAEQHSESHGNQVRAKILILPGVSHEERQVLAALKHVQFHCGGRIEVFMCMKEANNAAIFAAYQNFVGAVAPQWMVKTDSPGNKVAFAQCVVLVPVFVNPAKEEIKLLNVWCPEKKKKHWAFMGGDVKRGVDRHLFDSARREFKEEVGIFFNRPWSECFQSELPDAWTEEETPAAGCLLYTHLEKDGVRYPCRPHFFVTVTEDFYEVTRAYEDASGVIQMSRSIQQAGVTEYVRWDELRRRDEDGVEDGDTGSEIAKRVHLEGVPFLEHDEARWVSLEFQTGKLSADDSRPLRRESAEMFKQRPERLWRYFADLLGVEPPARESILPSDFNEESPLAVRVSGIDKTAQDQDLIDFFEGVDVKVTGVRQFEVPKHTARVDVEDKESLERALAMNMRTLLRRKVKIELWSEAGSQAQEDGAIIGAKPMKEYTGPLPEEAPWMCRVRGLDRSVTKDDLGYFFWDRDCQVSDVHFPLKGERHAGIIEFKDLESLRRAMGLNNAIFKGREVTVELSNKGDIKRDEMSSSSRGGGGSSRGAGGGFGSGSFRGRGGGKGGGGGYTRDREPPSRAEFGSERPRLNLKPRSVPFGEESGRGFGDDRGGYSNRPDPFAGARPRDDRFKSTRADADDNWRR